MKLLLVAGLAWALVCFAQDRAPDGEVTVPLFTIQRTQNINELRYEARLTSAGFPPKDAISIYWLMKAKDGHREKLTALEKQKAYGISVVKSSDSEVVFTLKAFKGRKITVRRVGKPGEFTAKAFTPINDEESELERLYITAEADSGLIPKVTKIEIFGRPRPDGTFEKETLIP